MATVVLLLAVVLVAGQATGVLRALGPARARAATPAPPPGSDFNGDGFADLAIPVPGDQGDFGGVNVVYGSANGLTTGGSGGIPANQLLNASNVNCFSSSTGGAVAWGDFNHDGFDDLAVQTGVFVGVVYGSASGLTDSGCTTIDEGPLGGMVTPVTGETFGATLAAGDFDGDGFDDLAIGDFSEWGAGGTVEASGRAWVVYGSANGLDESRFQSFQQGKGGLSGGPHTLDWFGKALAAGDFDGDGHMDLAIGVPGDKVIDQPGAGDVAVLYGSPTGLAPFSPDRPWSQYGYFIPDNPEPGDSFGSSLVAANFGRGPQADLAVGVPDERFDGVSETGVVTVIYGSPDGLAEKGGQTWGLDSPGVAGAAHQGDLFGSAVAAGDFDGSGVADLAVGIWGETLSGKDFAGGVAVLYGTTNGLSANGSQVWNESSAGVDTVEEGDEFGQRVSTGDFDHDGRTDLGAGACGESLGSIRNAGAEAVLYGSNAGLTGDGNQFWHQKLQGQGLQGTAQEGDRFSC